MTKEESERERELTIARFRDFNYDAGEDFLDGFNSINVTLFCGFLLAKYQTISKDILDILNKKGDLLNVNSFTELLGYDEEADINTIYYVFVEFANLTMSLKARINQVLIQVDECYGE